MLQRFKCIVLDAPDIYTDFGYELYEMWNYPRDRHHVERVEFLKYRPELAEYLKAHDIDLTDVDFILFKY